MKLIKYSFSLVACFLVLSAVGFGQETQVKVVDEVIAQVNDGVITLSRVKREMKEAVDSFVAEGKSRAEAEKMVAEKQGELIANLINEELLVQKAKESNLTAEIEAAVNNQLKEVMQKNGIKTVDDLYKEMEKQGVDPQELKENWRKQATRDMVIQREVQSKIYWKANGTELKAYFDKNKAKFTKPETVSFSELFLAYAGRDEKAVKDKAAKLLEQLKGGANWDKLVQDNADKPLVTDGKGKFEKLPVKDMNQIIGKPLDGVPVGGYTKPIEIEQLGVAILRVDARDQQSDQSFYDENAIRMAILSEQFPTEQKKFLAKLRDESFIKISDTYRPIVAPILFEDERKAKGSTN